MNYPNPFGQLQNSNVQISEIVWIIKSKCMVNHTHLLCTPYSGKFLRGPIFAVFVDDRLTVKIIWCIMGMSVRVHEN